MPEAPTMIRNRAGGWAFEIDDWTRLQRFLILGTDEGSYYASARELTREAALCIDRLLEAGQGLRVVQQIVEISAAGRAPKNDPAILALALCLKTAPDVETRRAASMAVPKVCRTGSHLASLVTAIEALGVPNGREPRKGSGGGWGPLTREAVRRWFGQLSPQDLAYQAIKYRWRQDWHLADWLRLAHPSAPTPEHGLLYDWILGRAARAPGRSEKSPRRETQVSTGIPLVDAYEEAWGQAGPGRVAELVREHRLPWEAIQDRFARDLEVQAALFERMPMGATVRQLGRLTSIGLLQPGGEHAKLACERITNRAALTGGRIHPMTIYMALRTYQAGHGLKGHEHWEPVPEIVTALEAAFFETFKVRPRSQRRIVVGVDCSDSMHGSSRGKQYAGDVNGIPGFQPWEAASVMAFTQVRGNPNAQLICFDERPLPVQLDGVETLGQLMSLSSKWMGLLGQGTDVAVPMNWALDTMPGVDGFAVWTDDETWAGQNHPVEALSAYRERYQRPSKLAIASVVAHGYRTAGAYDDAGLLQVVGFDEAAPAIIDDFLEAPIAAPARPALTS